jgi:hypothetical protein
MKKILSVIVVSVAFSSWANDYTGIVTCKPKTYEKRGIVSLSVLGDENALCALPNGKAVMLQETEKQKYLADTIIKKVDRHTRVAESSATEEVDGRIVGIKTTLQYNNFSKKGTLTETMFLNGEEDVIVTPMECQLLDLRLDCPNK